jgi:hypothetical protein
VRELAHRDDFRREAMNGGHSRAILLAKRLFYQQWWDSVTDEPIYHRRPDASNVSTSSGASGLAKK